MIRKFSRPARIKPTCRRNNFFFTFGLTSYLIILIVLLMPSYFPKTAARGFSLIELIIVITIIAILSLLGYNSFIGAQERARDAKRKSDVNQVYKALELYFKDHETAPDTIPFGDSWMPYFLTTPLDPRNGSQACSGNTCGYIYAKSANCAQGTSCVGYQKPALWVYLERCDGPQDTGEASVLGYGCPYFIKVLPYK